MSLTAGVSQDAAYSFTCLGFASSTIQANLSDSSTFRIRTHRSRLQRMKLENSDDVPNFPDAMLIPDFSSLSAKPPIAKSLVFIDFASNIAS
jgi:hypothetical protein